LRFDFLFIFEIHYTLYILFSGFPDNLPGFPVPVSCF
jgi:hypothetical protein